MARQEQARTSRRGIFRGRGAKTEQAAPAGPGEANPFEEFLIPGTDGEELRQQAVRILELLFHRGQSRRADEQTWTIDQVVRELTGDRYEAFVEAYSFDEEFGTSHDWSTGKEPQ